jgi:hypothetical protein
MSSHHKTLVARGLHVIAYRATLDVSRELVTHVASLLLWSRQRPRGQPLTPATNNTTRIRQLGRHQPSQDQPYSHAASVDHQRPAAAAESTSHRFSVRYRLKSAVIRT